MEKEFIDYLDYDDILNERKVFTWKSWLRFLFKH